MCRLRRRAAFGARAEGKRRYCASLCRICDVFELRGSDPGGSDPLEQAPQHERQDAAVAEVLALDRSVEPEARTEFLLVGAHGDLARVAVVDALDRELFPTRQPERRGVLAVEVL